jgi:hypothetical protein
VAFELAYLKLGIHRSMAQHSCQVTYYNISSPALSALRPPVVSPPPPAAAATYPLRTCRVHARARAHIYACVTCTRRLSKPLHPLTRRATLRRRRRRRRRRCRCRRVLRLSVPNVHTDSRRGRARERASNIVNLYVFEFQEGEQNHPNIFTRGNRVYSRGKTLAEIRRASRSIDSAAIDTSTSRG